MGRENLDGIEATIERHGIDCGWEATGTIAVATAPHQLPWLEEEAEALRALRLGGGAARPRRRARAGGLADLPRRPAGQRDGCALVDPARLCWGLARAAEAAGATVHESTPRDLAARDGDGVRADCPGGAVRARRALLATSAFPPLVRAIRRYVVPVYDYVLVTEPLSGGAARRDRLARARRGSPTSPTSSTTTARPTTTGSSGAATTRSTTSAGASRPSATRARRRSRCSRSTSSRRSRSSSGSASRTAGAARSTPAAASARCGDGRSAAARSTSSASPGSASAPAASARAWARPARRARHGAHAAGDGAAPAAPVPARAGALGGDHAHAARARARGPPRGPARAVAAHADRLGLGFDS